MRTVGVFNVIQNDSTILLIKRNNPPLWDLPGGTLEQNEQVLECLQRTTFEETGLITEPIKKVGTFINQNLADEQIIYCSKVVAGSLKKDGIQLKFTALKHLPLAMVPHRKKQIKLALTNDREVVTNVADSSIVKLIKKIKH